VGGVDPNLIALLEQLGAGGDLQQSFKDDPYEFLEMGLKYEGYPAVRIDLSEQSSIPEGTKTLALVGPVELTPRQKYEINRFLVQGGSVFMAVQNYEFNYKPSRGDLELVPNEKKPEVNGLLEAWGFKVDTRVLGDEQNEAVNVAGGRSGFFETSFPVRLPIQIVLTPSEMNSKVSITSQLPAFFYLWGSALVLDQARIASQNLKVETLLSSSRDSWTVPFKSPVMLPQELLRGPQSPGGPFPLAVFAQGQFADAFQGIGTPGWADEKDSEIEGEGEIPEQKPAIEEEPLRQAPGKLVLIGAATPFQKQLIQGGGHMAFFINSIDILTLGDDLIGIRSKGTVSRALPKVSRAAKLFWRFFTTLCVPFLIAIAGFLHFYFRGRIRQRYLKNLS